MNITLNAKINDLQSQLNTKMSKGKLQISAIQEKLGKVEEDSTQLNATFIENAEELVDQIEELRESVNVVKRLRNYLDRIFVLVFAALFVPQKRRLALDHCFLCGQMNYYRCLKSVSYYTEYGLHCLSCFL